MREILFRGKRLDNGEWVEGWYQPETTIKHWDGRRETIGFTITYKVEEGFLEDTLVDQSTVGQYTGLMDKNGKRIFEGDIVAQNWYDYDEPRDDSFGKVVFCEYDCSFSVMDVNKDGFMPLGRCGSYHWEVEVIGNIHDNPEMLKGGDLPENRAD